MAETEIRPNLGQRVIGSAKGLACSTFSGVVGIEDELRDPLRSVSGGKALAAPNGVGRIEKSDAAARRKASNAKALSAFRTKRAIETMTDEVFNEWAGKSATLDSSRTNGLSSTDQQGTPLKEDIFHFGQQETPDLETSWQNSRRKVAGERLSQVERHISGSFALRTRSSTFVEPYGGLDIQDQRMLHGERLRVDAPIQDLLEVVQPGSHASLDRPWSSTDTPYPSAHMLAKPRHETLTTSPSPSTTHLKQPSQPALQSALSPPLTGSSPSTRYLTCPLPSCHDLLTTQNANLPLSIHQRCCIHTGCGYVSQDLEGWVRHCTSRHEHAERREREKGEECKNCAIKDRGILSTDFRFVVEGRCCGMAAA